MQVHRGDSAAVILDRPAVTELIRGYLTKRPPTALRVGSLAAWGAAFASVRLAVQGSRKLDEIFFRQFHETKVKEPFFIFSTPRSGSTLLQYLMTLDDERFTHITLWQTILPTVSFNRFMEKAVKLHSAVGSPFDPVMEKFSEFLFGGWDGIHTLGFARPEEDEAIFVFTGIAPGLVLMFPDITQIDRIQHFDEEDPELREKVMAYYESAVQRHLYATGGDRQYLNKNVFTMSRVKSLYEHFQDGRFIFIMRHPYDAIPSCINLFYVCWKAHCPDIPMKSEETRRVAQWAIDGYRKAWELRNVIPKEQYLIVTYEELVASPVTCVKKIYTHYGMEMSDRFRARLAEVGSRQQTEEFKATFKYTLDDYGIERDFVYDQLSDIFEAFGYPR